MREPTPSQSQRVRKLREIGWTHWDPLQLLGVGGHFSGRWDDEDNIGFSNEYDSYLISAVEQLQHGVARAQVVSYLVGVEKQTMAIDNRPDAQGRANSVVDALMANAAFWDQGDDVDLSTQSRHWAEAQGKRRT